MLSTYVSLHSILYVSNQKQSEGGGLSLFRYSYLLKVKPEEVGLEVFGVTSLTESSVVVAEVCRN